MKYILLLSAFIFYQKTNAQTLKDSLMNINYHYYLNKPIDSLLQALPQSYDSIYTRAGSSAFVGATVVVDYGTMKPMVYITPGTKNYFTPANPSHQPPSIAWPINLVKQEQTWQVTIYSLFFSDPWPLKQVCCGN
ncbi:MAG TPA: hypothetical protein PK504_02240 [Ferruginibacter sp.]|nr:hypothetical protein [Ferruginibacter sp.]HRE63376.1 hypothetical protein [Ferruginibacter sp.]